MVEKEERKCSQSAEGWGRGEKGSENCLAGLPSVTGAAPLLGLLPPSLPRLAPVLKNSLASRRTLSPNPGKIMPMSGCHSHAAKRGWKRCKSPLTTPHARTFTPLHGQSLQVPPAGWASR